MAEQQLVDYLKKAKEAGQADEQSKSLLSKNGWTDQEISEAFAALGQPQARPQTSPGAQFPPREQQPAQQQTQPQYQPQAQAQPQQPRSQFSSQTQTQPASQPQAQSQVKPPEEIKTYAQSYSKPPQDFGTLTEKKKSHFLLNFFIILIVFAVLGAGGYFLVAETIGTSFNFKSLLNILSFKTPSPAPIPNSAEELAIMKAWENMTNAKTGTFSYEVSASSKDLEVSGASQPFNLSIKSSGSADASNRLANMQILLLSGIKNSVMFSVESRIIKDDVYVKLNEINFPDFTDMAKLLFNIDLSKIKGQWIKINPDDFSAGFTGRAVSSNNQQNETEALNKIVKILFDKKAFNIKNIAEGHYFVSLDQQKIINASPEILDVLKNYYSKTYPNQPLPAEFTLENFQKSVKDFFSNTGELGADVFIDKNSKTFNKIQFSKDINAGEFDSNQKGTITINLTMEQSATDSPAQITAPQNWVNFKSFIPGATERSNMEQILVMGKNICVTNKTCADICNNGLLNGYEKTFGKQFIALHNEIVKVGSKKPACFADEKNFCVSTKLADGTYLCAGGSSMGTAQCVSAETICK